MENDTATLSGIVDIKPPVEPILYSLENTIINGALMTTIIVLVLLIIMGFIWLRYFTQKGKSRYQILKLQQQLAVNRIDHQKAACQLSKILRKNLGLSPVLTRTPVPEVLAAHKLRWDSFTELLSRACYSSVGVDQEQTKSLLKEAYFWVKSWPSHNNG